MDTALVIKENWCNEIFDHGKTWEIRGDQCKKRGRFAIAASGTGTLVGEATMVNCLKVGKLDEETGELKRCRKEPKKNFIARPNNFKKHRIKDFSIVTYPKVYAWVFNDVVKYKTPLPYIHPQGAIKWIKLDEGAANATADVAEDSDCGYRSSPEPSRASSSSSSSSSSSKRSEEPVPEDSGDSPADAAALAAEPEPACLTCQESVHEDSG